jgi:assimilatory nitrate reductase catalytic subunit
MQWGGERPFGNARFETPDGKARFVPTVATLRQVDQTLPFTLNTGRIRDQWHTMTRTGMVPRLFGHRAEPFVELHSADARKLDLKDADLISIKGRVGASVVRLLVTDAVMQGEAFQPMHWSSPFASAPLANDATLALVDPFSGQPALKSASVEIVKYLAQWFGFGVSMNLTTPKFDYWASRPLAGGQSFECAGLDEHPNWAELLAPFVAWDDNAMEASSVAGTSETSYRRVVTRKGRLYFAFFAHKRPVNASRHWLQQQLGKDVVAAQILAGRPSAKAVDIGPIVCACNCVGRNQISLAIASSPNPDLRLICESTTAGMGCGSCRPEVQRMINDMPRFAEAAE